MIGPAGPTLPGRAEKVGRHDGGLLGDQSFLFHPDRFPVRRTITGDDVTHPGATAVLNIPKLAGARTYRVWQVKQLQFQRRIILRMQDPASSRPRTLCTSCLV